jgi:surfactin family lipopeptide synthetase A
MVGGEIFTPNLLKTLKNKTKAKIYNMYGPTEATIWVTISELTRKNEVDLGAPIQNTQIYIIDENQNITTDEKIGEIAIAGACLAECYHGDEQLTNDKFIHLSTGDLNFRAYKTGDMGRVSENRLFYIGRKDNQVKIRGNRIELEEVEFVLNANSHIHQSVVTDVTTSSNDKILVAFILENSHINDYDICLFLKEYLPEYMIPVKYVRVDKFEYTFNEKIDRKLLKEKYLTVEVVSGQNNDSFTLEDDILNVIKSNVDQTIFGAVTLDTDLLSSGIDSITFMSTVVALEESFNFEFEDEMLLITKFPTLRSMVEYVASKAQ